METLSWREMYEFSDMPPSLASQVLAIGEAASEYFSNTSNEDFNIIPVDEQWIIDNADDDFIVVMTLKGEEDWDLNTPVSVEQMIEAKNSGLIVHQGSAGHMFMNNDWKSVVWAKANLPFEKMVYRTSSKEATNRDYWLLLGIVKKGIVLNFTHQQLKQLMDVI